MKTALEVIAKMKAERSSPRLVRDWRKSLPAGSRWTPGDPGNPACKLCKGTGYVRFDLPVIHADFGRIYLCECAANKGLELKGERMGRN